MTAAAISISLNPAGKKRLAQLRAISKGVESELLASLDAEQRAQLHEILLQLAADHDPRYAPVIGSGAGHEAPDSDL